MSSLEHEGEGCISWIVLCGVKSSLGLVLVSMDSWKRSKRLRYLPDRICCLGKFLVVVGVTMGGAGKWVLLAGMENAEGCRGRSVGGGLGNEMNRERTGGNGVVP